MKILLIFHNEDDLDFYGLSSWLASFSALSAIIVLKERISRLLTCVQKEIKRVGLFSFFDIVAFKIYYLFFIYRKDKLWKKKKLEKLFAIYPKMNENIPILYTNSPNLIAVKEFLKQFCPDIVIA